MSDHVEMLLSRMDDSESLPATNPCPEFIGTASRQPTSAFQTNCNLVELDEDLTSMVHVDRQAPATTQKEYKNTRANAPD